MASHGYQMQQQVAPGQVPQPGYGVPMAAPAVTAPAGTFAPGTKIQVGGHRVLIQKYLSEGGFAHVYLVKLPKPVDGTDLAVLKRVAVPDKDALRSMRTEVETMKRLKGHRAIVTYIDSHASEMRGGGYEVFLLMEYCNGGGLIDFMNTRLQHRLTEPEIINIFADIAEGVACMHYLKPPLLHRDIKVENVLITSRGSSKRFKVCDFGSAAEPKPAPTTVVECRLMDEDIQKHTTLQYRSPEMVDVYRKQPMNEKADIWALGVLLYKLCYYTTPFEEQGQLAILNASFRYPSHPIFSDRLKKLIASMLKESIQARPNIYEVLKEACLMQGREIPVQDIYAGRSSSEAHTSAHRVSTSQKPQAKVGAVYSPAAQEQQSIVPDVVPMRRGRPTASPAPGKSPDSSSKKVTDGDPFAALDSKNAAPSIDVDEVSSRFPSLNQFSLLHDQGGFNFDPSSPTAPTKPSIDMNPKLTERLADAAFAPARQSSPNNIPLSRPHSAAPTPRQGVSPSPAEEVRLKPSPSVKPEPSRPQSIATASPQSKLSASNPTSRYVSTGTWTGDLSPQQTTRDWSKTPSQTRSTDLPRTSSLPKHTSSNPSPLPSGQNFAATTNPRVSSLLPHIRQPSLEGSRPRPELLDSAPRSVNLPSRPRPVSTSIESSTVDFLRENEQSRPQSRLAKPSPRDSPRIPSPNIDALDRNENRLGDTDKDEDADDRRWSSVEAPGPKSLSTTKFGDAFKRFESNASSPAQAGSEAPSSLLDLERTESAPAASSSATHIRKSNVTENEQELTPEMRRDLERRQLEEEEQRVEAAQAEYRKRVAEGGSSSKPTPGPKNAVVAGRASSIQNRVQGLLSQEQQPSSVQRTAHGYGKYTDTENASSKNPAAISRKPLAAASKSQSRPSPSGISSAPPALSAKPTGAKPAPPAPKKPMHLNSLPTGAGRPSSPTKEGRQPPKEQLIAVDLPGQPVIQMSAREKDDYIEDFAKRFPSLSAIEMEPSGGGRGGNGSRR